ncbi:hypothetical protein [Labilibaculum sp.]|uniref:hypothetical protein n=1 Tax=Labilibaculum sp. TaxID=2060723 RepID=UPI002AA7FFEF|nr:hypothetical protein [Labilibaculum sp.]
MEVNKQGIFTDITFWKLGCNWGSGQPSFYNEIKSRDIVIGHQSNGIYMVGDIVLLGEGHSIKALAKIIDKPIPINSQPALVSALSKFNVGDFGKISYYNVELYEIPQKEIFKYQLQQGIVRVHKEHIKRKATQCWLQNPSYSDKRIMRLTWNSNNWEFPSGHTWCEKNQNNSNIAYENQYGYGHEEWLLNERFRIDGYQYGYIRGVNNLSTDVEVIDQITLYTIREDKQRCLVGNLYNVEIIEGVKGEENKIKDLISNYKSAMLEELKEVNADFEHFRQDQLLPNVKFSWEMAELFQQPIPVDFLDGAEFNRFQAYYLKEELIEPIQKEFEEKSKFKFQAGKALNTGEYTKSTSKKNTKVKRRHGEITDDLYDYLITAGNSENNISVEKTRVGGAILDVVLKEESDTYVLFEIKTSNSALNNIRQAFGQIFEYAFLDAEIKCTKLVIVGPASLQGNDKDYFNRIRELINIKLEYWEYKSSEKNIENKFIIE